MLVLTRKINERIKISGGIEIVVLKISGTKVKLGIDAPAAVEIQRAELDALALAPVEVAR